MEYAKIIGDKVVRVSTEITDEGLYLPLYDKTKYETKYNRLCYEFDCNIPKFIINPTEVLSVKTLSLLPLQVIKDTTLELQKKKRKEKQLGYFLFKGVEVPLKDREASLIITSLPELPTNFKIGKGKWLSLTSVDVVAFKQAHHEHVQSAYEWEMEENSKVNIMTTVSELSTYIEGIL